MVEMKKRRVIKELEEIRLEVIGLNHIADICPGTWEFVSSMMRLALEIIKEEGVDQDDPEISLLVDQIWEVRGKIAEQIGDTVWPLNLYYIPI